MFQVLMIVEIILSVYSTNSSSDLSYDAALKALGFARMTTSDRTAGYKKLDGEGKIELELLMDYDSKGQQGTYFNL